MMDPIFHNRSLWDRWTALHLDAPMYDFTGFRAGISTLHPVEELEFVPRAAGSTLLHLQCHVGLDTLSLARAGANVTGIDFSPAAIKTAQALSAETGVPGRFVQGEVDAAAEVAGTGFDLVFTSYGVLSWLPNLKRWASAIHACLRPGGTFYMVEHHPIIRVLSPRKRDDLGQQIECAYFGSSEPIQVMECGSYAHYDENEAAPAFYWVHTLGDVVSALCEAGLVPRFLHEHQVDPTNDEESLHGGPCLFSIEAFRPAVRIR